MAEHSVRADQAQVGAEVARGGDGVDDDVEPVADVSHLFRVSGDDQAVLRHPRRPPGLFGERGRRPPSGRVISSAGLRRSLRRRGGATPGSAVPDRCRARVALGLNVLTGPLPDTPSRAPKSRRLSLEAISHRLIPRDAKVFRNRGISLLVPGVNSMSVSRPTGKPTELVRPKHFRDDSRVRPARQCRRNGARREAHHAGNPGHRRSQNSRHSTRCCVHGRPVGGPGVRRVRNVGAVHDVVGEGTDDVGAQRPDDPEGVRRRLQRGPPGREDHPAPVRQRRLQAEAARRLRCEPGPGHLLQLGRRRPERLRRGGQGRRAEGVGREDRPVHPERDAERHLRGQGVRRARERPRPGRPLLQQEGAGRQPASSRRRRTTTCWPR